MPKTLEHKTDFRQHRARAYAPPGDALDAIQKGFRALIDQGLTLPAETVAWVEACEAVKGTFKKRGKE